MHGDLEQRERERVGRVDERCTRRVEPAASAARALAVERGSSVAFCDQAPAGHASTPWSIRSRSDLDLARARIRVRVSERRRTAECPLRKVEPALRVGFALGAVAETFRRRARKAGRAGTAGPTLPSRGVRPARRRASVRSDAPAAEASSAGLSPSRSARRSAAAGENPRSTRAMASAGVAARRPRDHP